MAISPVDRNTQYMKDTWGTTKLITDYGSEPKKILQEIMYDPALTEKSTKQELFETNDDEFSYGIEPIYKIETHQKLISE
jgi:hypothetical protein